MSHIPYYDEDTKDKKKEAKMLDNMADNDLIIFYKTEYHKEWNMACKNGIKLTATDIRNRLGLK